MKSGFVAIMGRPNVGKSTLLNTILQKKVSIISSKAQTTRNAIQGIYTSPEAQIVFIDTPGIHKPLNQLGEFMNHEALSSTREVEAILLMVDASLSFGEGDRYVVERVPTGIPVFVVLNKIDLCSIPEVEAKTAQYHEMLPEAQIIPLSALQNVAVDTLLNALIAVLPEGPQYFPDGVYSDHPETFLVAELIREKILGLLREEVPHSIAVLIERFEMKQNEALINATIICEKESQKAIIIGKGGKMIKRIGMQARYDIERLLGISCRLETFVRVEKEWRNSLRYLKEFGYGKGSAGWK